MFLAPRVFTCTNLGLHFFGVLFYVVFFGKNRYIPLFLNGRNKKLWDVEGKKA